MAGQQCSGARHRLRHERLRVVPAPPPPTPEEHGEVSLGIAAAMREFAADLGLGDPYGRWCANEAAKLEAHAERIAPTHDQDT